MARNWTCWGRSRWGAAYRFSFSYSVTDIEILADLAPSNRTACRQAAFGIAAGMNKSTHFNQINCGSISVAYVPKVTHRTRECSRALQFRNRHSAKPL